MLQGSDTVTMRPHGSETTEHEDVLLEWLKTADGRWRRALANDSATPPNILDELSRDRVHADVPGAVASNPATQPEVLQRLGSDDNESVRARVASNPATPPEVLQRLGSDDNESVRARAARNLHSPRQTPDSVVRDHEDYARTSAQEERQPAVEPGPAQVAAEPDTPCSELNARQIVAMLLPVLDQMHPNELRVALGLLDTWYGSVSTLVATARRLPP